MYLQKNFIYRTYLVTYKFKDKLQAHRKSQIIEKFYINDYITVF